MREEVLRVIYLGRNHKIYPKYFCRRFFNRTQMYADIRFHTWSKCIGTLVGKTFRKKYRILMRLENDNPDS